MKKHGKHRGWDNKKGKAQEKWSWTQHERGKTKKKQQTKHHGAGEEKCEEEKGDSTCTYIYGKLTQKGQEETTGRNHRKEIKGKTGAGTKKEKHTGWGERDKGKDKRTRKE